MATTVQIQTARASAGSDYAAAVQNLVDKYVALAAYDAAVGATGGGKPQPSFNDMFGLGSVPMHPAYMTEAQVQAVTTPNVVSPAVAAQAQTVIASWSGS